MKGLRFYSEKIEHFLLQNLLCHTTNETVNYHSSLNQDSHLLHKKLDRIEIA